MKKFEKSMHHHCIKLEYNTKVISKSHDYRIYKDAVLLTPGEWSDSITNSPIRYSSIALSKYASNWIDRYLNLDHNWSVVNRIGVVENPKFFNGKLMADLYINPITTNARDTIALIDANMIRHLSVELQSDDYWDSSDRIRCADNIQFMGCAVVTSPADINTRIK